GSVADYLQAYPDAKLGTETGVYIAQIYTDSPATKAGLKEGDIIVSLEDKKIETMTQLISGLFKYRPGDTVKLSVIRDGRTMTFNVTLTTMAEETGTTQTPQAPQTPQ
ncbi:MAG TPA: PDZ domain-containing protein, partial [Anaerovoracaceae bacterium]|nr:PDZ domain-containing protein [Anaerovoracaceae bacterium]